MDEEHEKHEKLDIVGEEQPTSSGTVGHGYGRDNDGCVGVSVMVVTADDPQRR